jgi:hypothetical protein
VIAAIKIAVINAASNRNNSDYECKNDIVLIILNINNLNDITIMSAKTVIQGL